MPNLNKYRKLIVAAIGLAALVVAAWQGETSTLYQTIVSVATALGVWATPNVA